MVEEMSQGLIFLLRIAVCVTHRESLHASHPRLSLSLLLFPFLCVFPYLSLFLYCMRGRRSLRTSLYPSLCFPTNRYLVFLLGSCVCVRIVVHHHKTSPNQLRFFFFRVGYQPKGRTCWYFHCFFIVAIIFFRTL